MRLLRHDFRRWYGCSYDEVPAEEAVDLVLTLPRGSLYRASLRPFGEWTEEREAAADIQDSVARLAQLVAKGTTEGAPTVVRPSDLEARAAASRRARDVRRRIEGTNWE